MSNNKLNKERLPSLQSDKMTTLDSEFQKERLLQIRRERNKKRMLRSRVIKIFEKIIPFECDHIDSVNSRLEEIQYNRNRIIEENQYENKIWKYAYNSTKSDISEIDLEIKKKKTADYIHQICKHFTTNEILEVNLLGI